LIVATFEALDGAGEACFAIVLEHGSNELMSEALGYALSTKFCQHGIGKEA